MDRADADLSAAAEPPAGLRAYLRTIVSAGPGRLAWVIAIQAAAGLGQAAGVLLLVPLLGTIGVHASSGVSSFTQGAFHSVGLRPTLTAVLSVYVLVTAATATLNAYQSVLSTRYRLEFVDSLRSRLYAAVANASWRHLMGARQSKILAVLTTNVSWVGLGTLSALQFVVSLIVIVAQLVAAVRVSATMTGLAVVVGIALVGVVWPLVRRSRRLGGQLVARNQQLLANATGFLDGLKLAKAFGREQTHVDAFNEAVRSARVSQIEFSRASGIATAVQGTLTALLLAVVVEAAVRGFHVATGSLLVVAFVFTRVVSQLGSVQLSIQQVAQALPAFDEVMALIGEYEDARETPATVIRQRPRIRIGDGISLQDVRFAYPEPHREHAEALTGISVEIPVGSICALAGPSGAGKSTTADIVAGLLRPTGGQVVVGGVPLTGEKMLAWRPSVALVPQDPFLFHDTIEANLTWAADAAEAQLWEALDAAAAADFVRLLPDGLATVVGDRGLQLSGGERQRLTLARALLRDPDLLILDEATNSLDSENEHAIKDALDRLRGRTTVLMIAHRTSMIDSADQVVVLEDGHVARITRPHPLSEAAAPRSA